MSEINTPPAAGLLPATTLPDPGQRSGACGKRAGNIAGATPGMSAIAPRGDDASRDEAAAQGGFEQLLVARVTLASTAANDAHIRVDQGAERISKGQRPAAGRGGESDLVAAVLAKTASLTATMQGAQAAAGAITPAVDDASPAQGGSVAAKSSVTANSSTQIAAEHTARSRAGVPAHRPVAATQQTEPQVPGHAATVPPTEPETETTTGNSSDTRERSEEPVTDAPVLVPEQLSATATPPAMPNVSAPAPSPLPQVETGDSPPPRPVQNAAATGIARSAGSSLREIIEQQAGPAQADQSAAPAESGSSAEKREATPLRADGNAGIPDAMRDLARDPARTPDALPRIESLASMDRAHAPAVRLAHPLGTPEWGHEFGTQITLFASRKDPQAELRVNPPELGPVEVRIGFEGDKVMVAFSAGPAETREAIQNALPQLREMLAERGLSLGNASVGTEASPREFAQAPRAGSFSSARDDAPVSVQPALRIARHLVDTFA